MDSAGGAVIVVFGGEAARSLECHCDVCLGFTAWNDDGEALFITDLPTCSRLRRATSSGSNSTSASNPGLSRDASRSSSSKEEHTTLKSKLVAYLPVPASISVSPVSVSVPAALLSRFDLLFYCWTSPRAMMTSDSRKHVTHVHMYNKHPYHEYEPLNPALMR